MPLESTASSAKVRLFMPLLAGVFATASAGCAAVIGIEALLGGHAIPGANIVTLIALALLAAGVALWVFAVRSDALPGSVRQENKNATWLQITTTAYAVLLLLTLLSFSWLWWSRLLLLPAACAMLYFLGAAHRVPGTREWMSRVQAWSPPFAALLLAVSIVAGCLKRPWAEIPLILLLLIDAGLSVARFQALDRAVRAARNIVTKSLRKSSNGAMLLRFFTGTIFAALFLGMRPGFVPVAILSGYIVDRLLLQVSVIMVHHSKATA